MMINFTRRSQQGLVALGAALSFSSGASAQNLLSNGSLEVDGPGFVVFQDWVQFNNVFEDESVEVLAQDGLQSAKMFGQFTPEGQSDNGIFQIVPVAAGNEYTLSAWAQSLSSDPLQAQDPTGSPGGNTFGHLALAIMDFRDSGGSVISSAEVALFENGVTPLDQWNQSMVSATAPAGAVEVQVTMLLIQWDLATGSIFVDNIELTEGSGKPQPCSPADLAEPFGVLNFSDVIAFLSAFGSGCE